jgi:hypothetical protein
MVPGIFDMPLGGSAPGGDRIGVGEVKFIGDLVPEPSPALLVAISPLGLALRRRR